MDLNCQLAAIISDVLCANGSDFVKMQCEHPLSEMTYLLIKFTHYKHFVQSNVDIVFVVLVV